MNTAPTIAIYGVQGAKDWTEPRPMERGINPWESVGNRRLFKAMKQRRSGKTF